MLDQTQTQTEVDPFDSASNPPEQTYDLFGKVEVRAWYGTYEKGTRGAVPFNPAVHDAKKKYTIIEMFVQPLAEIDIKYPKSLEYQEAAEFSNWKKHTWPSLKAHGISNVREINDRWARVTRVANGKTYDKKDKATRQPTGETGEETTWKFVAFFADEDACRAAYIAAGGKSNGANGHNAPVAINPNAEDGERVQARNIMTVVINNVAPGKTTFTEVQEAVKAHAFYPHISKHYPADSVETMALITEITKLLPF